MRLTAEEMKGKAGPDGKAGLAARGKKDDHEDPAESRAAPRLSGSKLLVASIVTSVATAVAVGAGCANDESKMDATVEIPDGGDPCTSDGGCDGGHDAGQDGGHDAGPDMDAGPDADQDSGPDADHDGGTDADAGPDVDSGTDSGPAVCGLESTGSLTAWMTKGTSYPIDDFSFTDTSGSSTSVTISVGCDGTPISGSPLTVTVGSTTPTVKELADAGKRITITVNGANAAAAYANIVVEDYTP